MEQRTCVVGFCLSAVLFSALSFVSSLFLDGFEMKIIKSTYRNKNYDSTEERKCDLDAWISLEQCVGECEKGIQRVMYNGNNTKCLRNVKNITCELKNPCTKPSPEIYLLGCDRCGSTYLYNLIDNNPSIHGANLMPNEEEYRKKEPSFWSKNANVNKTELERYRARFPYHIENPAIKYIDATPSYGRMPYVPQNIKNSYPKTWQNLKFIWIFRNPAERALSYYKWAVEHCHHTEYDKYFCKYKTDDYQTWLQKGIESFQSCWPYNDTIPTFNLTKSEYDKYF
eukprot:UN28149